MTPKIKLRNSSGVPLVRFRGVHFDPHEQFTYDVAEGVTQAVQQVPNGEISVTAYRVSDARVLGTLTYGVSDQLGFAAILIASEEENHPFRLVGEAYVIESRIARSILPADITWARGGNGTAARSLPRRA